ncbi:TIGR03619 family F420-dependent LLM class oxidoreductase [Streptomyces novaecaesareae]|uniref:TIGR03619 family F420-dependent LLM class oxidoreductase n=1 Tax=Streptomyces novaecaesareae TaxID=68244 RepID=UPI0004AA5B68|nr:TIGR03619 family F420-dependent LLM class oxidoreductase [Streptomyces novaecaesareae]
MPQLRLGVSLQPAPPTGDGLALLRSARRAEELGFDHVAVGNRLLESGFGLDTDPFVLLATVAGATTRLRLLTSVLVAPYYPAPVLANQAATLDVLSGGRLILGVGTGWNPEEFAAVGVPVRERGARTDDHLAAARALWSHRPADFDGRFTTLRGARLGVAPATPGGPPVWIGGHSDAALRRVLRLGDGWYGTGVDPDQLTAVRNRLRELAAEQAEQAEQTDGPAGTAPERLTLASALFLTPPGIPAIAPPPGRLLGGDKPTAARVAEELSQLATAGLEVCTLWLPIAGEHLEEAMEWIAAEVVPLLA